MGVGVGVERVRVGEGGRNDLGKEEEKRRCRLLILAKFVILRPKYWPQNLVAKSVAKLKILRPIL